MPSILWRVCWIACLTAVAIAGIDWGLPRSAADATLFASHGPWDGQTLASFDGKRNDAAVGSDVDRDPLQRSAGPTPLNATDADRAAIARRYKLYSHQPDEMNTFMALQQMRLAERQFDPRMYKYGGVWVYGVGGLLKAASLVGFVELKPSTAFYYDRPEAFGRFYVVARLYTLAAYVLTMTLSAMILWRLTGDEWAAGAGAAVVGALPVVFALAHDAKPHVGGTAFILLTALLGARYARTRTLRDAIAAGISAGLAAGTVMSAAVAVLMLPAMVLLPRPPLTMLLHDSPGRRVAALLLAGLAAFAAFGVTNPYVVLHALHRDAVLASTTANSSAFYSVGSATAILVGGGRRLIDAMSWPAAAVAAVGFVLAITRRERPSALAVLLWVPSAVALVPFFAFAAGQSAEYARFALLPAVTLGILGVWAVTTISRPWLRGATLAMMPLTVLAAGTLPYVNAFAADVTDDNTRTRAAAVLRALPPGTVQVSAEPAPYATPAVDLWARRMELLPPNEPPTADAFVRAVDEPDALAAVPPGYRRQVISGGRAAPITWANKPFEILVRGEQER